MLVCVEGACCVVFRVHAAQETPVMACTQEDGLRMPATLQMSDTDIVGRVEGGETHRERGSRAH